MIEQLLENCETVTKEVYIRFIRQFFSQPYLCVGIKKEIKEITVQAIENLPSLYIFSEYSDARRFQDLNPTVFLYYIENPDFVHFFSALQKADINVFYCYFIEQKYKKVKLNQRTLLNAIGTDPVSNAEVKKVRKIRKKGNLATNNEISEMFKVMLSDIKNAPKIMDEMHVVHLIQFFEKFKEFYKEITKEKNEEYEQVMERIIKLASDKIFVKFFKKRKIYVPTDTRGNILYNVDEETINVYEDYFSALGFKEKGRTKRHCVKTINFCDFIDFLDELKDSMIKGIIFEASGKSAYIPFSQNIFIDEYGAKLKRTNINLCKLNLNELENTKPTVLLMNNKPEVSGTVLAFFNKKSFMVWSRKHNTENATTEQADFEQVMSYVKENDTCHGICMFGYAVPDRKMHYIYINEKDFSSIGENPLTRK